MEEISSNQISFSKKKANSWSTWVKLNNKCICGPFLIVCNTKDVEYTNQFTKISKGKHECICPQVKLVVLKWDIQQFFYLDPAYILQYWYKTIKLCDLFELVYSYMQEVGSGETSSPLPDIDIGGKLLPY